MDHARARRRRRLRHPLSGSRFSKQRYEALIASHDIVAIPKHRSVDDVQLPADLVLVITNLKATKSLPVKLAPESGKAHYLVTWSHEDVNYSVFDSRANFDHYCDYIANQIMSRVTSGLFTKSHDADRDLVRLGLILRAAHPAMNAMLAFFSPIARREAVTKLRRANLKSDKAKAEFDELMRVLLWPARTQPNDPFAFYNIKLDGGIAKGGGVDSDDASHFLGGVSGLHPGLAQVARDERAWLGKSSPPRFAGLEDHSAEFKFKVAIEGQTINDRLTRYFELRLLERALAGDERVQLTQQDANRLHYLSSPTDETIVTHKPLDAKELVSVRETKLKKSEAEDSTQLIVIAGMQGIKGQTNLVEALLAPRRTVTLPINDNGRREAPAGVRYLRNESSWLYRLAVCAMYRRKTLTGMSFYLKQIGPLENPPRVKHVTAAPSGLVEGAFVYGLNIAIEFTGTTPLLDGQPLIRQGQGVDAMESAIESYAMICHEAETEAAAAGRAHWLPPRKLPVMRSGEKFALALLVIGGDASILEISEKAQKLFDDVPYRPSNIRRDLKRAAYAKVSDDSQRASLTKLGRATARAYEGCGYLDANK